MTKTKIQKVLAYLALAGMTGLVSNVDAVQIGTGTITGGSTAVINWNGTYTTASASGTLNGIVVTATVAPSLNLTISTGAIALGTLNASTYVTGSVDMEVGTNARNGVSITAKSSSGGLYSPTTTNTLNNLTADGLAESYRFSSALNAAEDSAFAITQTATLDTEVNDNTTSHTVYTTDKPEALSGTDDVFFRVSSKIDAQTAAASDYTDTVQITVTGNF